MPERLRRLERLFTEHPLYWVSACTDGRRPILARKEIHEAFVDFCTAALVRRVFVGRYVLMPDHLHLFACFSDGALSLSDWVKSLKNSLSKTLRALGVAAPHWQKGFFDHVLRGQESYSEKWHYALENPVRDGLVKTWEKWPWQGEIYPLQI